MLTLCFCYAEIWCLNICKNLAKEVFSGKTVIYDWLNSENIMQKNSHTQWPHVVFKTTNVAIWKDLDD